MILSPFSDCFLYLNAWLNQVILWISISNVEKDIFVSDIKSFGNFKNFMN